MHVYQTWAIFGYNPATIALNTTPTLSLLRLTLHRIEKYIKTTDLGAETCLYMHTLRIVENIFTTRLSYCYFQSKWHCIEYEYLNAASNKSPNPRSATIVSRSSLTSAMASRDLMQYQHSIYQEAIPTNQSIIMGIIDSN